MAKETMNAKELLADIKEGMDDARLMEKYWLSGISFKLCSRSSWTWAC